MPDFNKMPDFNQMSDFNKKMQELMKMTKEMKKFEGTQIKKIKEINEYDTFIKKNKDQ
jgi:hypothetical protein